MQHFFLVMRLFFTNTDWSKRCINGKASSEKKAACAVCFNLKPVKTYIFTPVFQSCHICTLIQCNARGMMPATSKPYDMFLMCLFAWMKQFISLSSLSATSPPPSLFALSLRQIQSFTEHELPLNLMVMNSSGGSLA